MANTTQETRWKLTEDQAHELVRWLRAMPKFKTWGIQAQYLSEDEANDLAEKMATILDIRGQDTVEAAAERLKASAHTMVGWTVYATRWPEGEPVGHVRTPEEERVAVMTWSTWPWPEEAT